MSAPLWPGSEKTGSAGSPGLRVSRCVSVCVSVNITHLGGLIGESIHHIHCWTSSTAAYLSAVGTFVMKRCNLTSAVLSLSQTFILSCQTRLQRVKWMSPIKDFTVVEAEE